jgi:hypothetical protein
MVMPQNSAWLLKVLISAYDSTSNVASSWELTAFFKRNGAGNPALVGAVGGTVAFAQDAGAVAWAATLAADATNKAVIINVTGAAGKTINWTAVVVDIAEVVN